DRYYPLKLGRNFFRNVWQFDRVLRSLSTMTLLYLAWPWAAFVILMLFRQSMRRAKIRPSHVLRCTIYSAHSGLPLVAGVWFFAVISAPRMLPFMWLFRRYAWTILLLILWGGVTLGLIRAYRRYLRFDHSVGVVLSVQVIFI